MERLGIAERRRHRHVGAQRNTGISSASEAEPQVGCLRVGAAVRARARSSLVSRVYPDSITQASERTYMRSVRVSKNPKS